MQNVAKTLQTVFLTFFIFGCSFCSIAGGFAWMVTRNPPYGDDTGLGILCISFPMAFVFTLIVLSALNWKAARNDLRALKRLAQKKSAPK